MKFTSETEIDIDVGQMAKAFAHMPSNDQAKFFAIAYREMATFTKHQTDGTMKELGEMGREMQMVYISDEFEKQPDARAFICDLWDMTREPEAVGGFVLDGGIPSPARAEEIRTWLDDNVGPRAVKNKADVEFATESSVGVSPDDYEYAEGATCEQLTVMEDGKFTSAGIKYFEARNFATPENNGTKWDTTESTPMEDIRAARRQMNYEFAVGAPCEQLTEAPTFTLLDPQARQFDLGDRIRTCGVLGRVVEIRDESLTLALESEVKYPFLDSLKAPLALGDYVHLKGDPSNVTWIVQRIHNNGTVDVVYQQSGGSSTIVTMATDDLERVSEQEHMPPLEVLSTTVTWPGPNIESEKCVGTLGAIRMNTSTGPRVVCTCRSADGWTLAVGSRVYLDVDASCVSIGRCTKVNGDGTVEVELDVVASPILDKIRERTAHKCDFGPYDNAQCACGKSAFVMSSNDDKAPESPNADKPKCPECGGAGEIELFNGVSPCSRGCKKP